MINHDIEAHLLFTAKLMELHNENPFKISALKNAAYKISKTSDDLINIGLKNLEQKEGIGKGIAQKIDEIVQTGTTKELEILLEKTPAGILEIMSIKGLGPKKVYQLWKELEIEEIGELLYACNENRLVTLKGFGVKTQEEIIKQINFKNAARNKALYCDAEYIVEEITQTLIISGATKVMAVSEFRRKCEIINTLELIYCANETIELQLIQYSLPITIKKVAAENWEKELFTNTATQEHLDKINWRESDTHKNKNEEAIYAEYKLPFIIPELREGRNELEWLKKYSQNDLVEYSDLKGCLHNHSKYSDGANTIKEMAQACIDLNLEYFGICDHSKTAFYAGGLKEEDIIKQHTEIDSLNKTFNNFKILKGIESDILNDGSLDYSNDVLETFDFIVASIHSPLRMNEEKAMMRLIKAIENPYTNILGHLTGRLLLSREGYPVNHSKIIDACAANKVVIELNANPHRLDIDWRWIDYCQEKGVLISINPDAHFTSGINDMKYGVYAARKGGLIKSNCLNALSLAEIEVFFNK